MGSGLGLSGSTACLAGLAGEVGEGCWGAGIKVFYDPFYWERGQCQKDGQPDLPGGVAERRDLRFFRKQM